jgi:hypothetical protein
MDRPWPSARARQLTVKGRHFVSHDGHRESQVRPREGLSTETTIPRDLSNAYSVADAVQSLTNLANSAIANRRLETSSVSSLRAEDRACP